MAVYELFVDDFFVVDQTTGSNPFGRAVQQTLVINETVKYMPYPMSFAQRFEVGQSAVVRKSVNHIGITQRLEFFQQGGKGPALQVITDHFHMVQTAKIIEYEAISQTLIITQTVGVQLAKNTTSTLIMTDSATYTVIRNRAITQTFVMLSGGTGYIPDDETYGITVPAFGGPNAPGC